jgi:Copper binding proteins, plastocyanin/azurin family
MGLLALLTVVGTLTGTVGTNDSFQIGLADSSGAAVKHLDPGTYTLVVHDKSDLHDFHLFGPGGVDVATQVETSGDQTFTVTLVDGIYTFQCDPHALAGMKGQFAVGTASLPVPVSRLTGSIAGSKATLNGTLLLKAGPATFAINDRSKTDGFLLSGPGVSKRTTIGGTGKVTWSVTLRPGTYTYGSLRSPKARRKFAVSSG